MSTKRFEAATKPWSEGVLWRPVVRIVLVLSIIAFASVRVLREVGTIARMAGVARILPATCIWRTGLATSCLRKPVYGVAVVRNDTY